MLAQPSFTLDSKFTQTEGTLLLSGVQALVRLPLDQQRADRRRGLNTAGLISGYRGSPLAGVDLLLERNATLLREHQISFIPGVNEDLGATMIFGSQIANLFPQPKYDGVIGMWYGKAPGADRSGDIFKHANFAGAGRYGGVLVVVGDDPLAKSSTLPSHSEPALYDALMPVLVPGSVQDVLDFGRLGFELSRFSGLWTGFKLVTLVADEFGTAEVGVDRLGIVMPELVIKGKPWQPTQTHTLGAPASLVIEQEIYEGRLVAAKAFAAANRINRIQLDPPDAWIGLVAAGKTYYELRQALTTLGLDDAALARYGVRLLQLGMIFPLESGIVETFARGLEEIVVVEEKRPFIELFLRDALYHRADRPRIVGKRDEQDRALFPAHGELDADTLAPLLAARLAQRIPREALAGQSTRRSVELPVLQLTMAAPPVSRTAYFCSGCPHNRSTVVPEGSLAGGGIGCHGLVHSMDRNTIGLGHMGGEGAQWAGIAPFSDMTHMFQNIGDGTFFHSGSLAVRQAIAAGTNITFKLLYNSAVGMTGGQVVDGAMSVPALTRALEAEGVQRIIVTSDNPDGYPAEERWAPGVEVWHRDRLLEAQEQLRVLPGVTVLIHDQMCAAERRRLRKRGRLPDPPTRVLINPAVCEGCGDCGVKSNCLSVLPIETEFGRKTQIHQSSCNKDYSCLLGDCPAFLTVVPAQEPQKVKRARLQLKTLPDPTMTDAPMWNIYMMGIGGTGVVTVNQVLGTAALLDGKFTSGLDQTGLSQKGGPVISYLRISGTPFNGSNRVAAGEADCYLAFDMLTASMPQHLSRAKAGRTIAVVSTGRMPTGAMVRSTEVHFPNTASLASRIDERTRADQNVYLDALALAETHFGDYLAANMIVLGAAHQRGLIPVSAAAIERAITINRVAVEMNLDAFRLGRQLIVDPNWQPSSAAQSSAAGPKVRPISRQARKLIDSVAATGELRRLIDIRVPELIAYQNAAYARSYVAFVQRVRAAEQAALPGQTRLSEAVARYLFKLMAYKDEYEVARLSLTTGLDQTLREQFGAGAQVQYHLHPPFLRALGWKKKLAFGKWFDRVYRLLMSLRWLRGSALDPFGYADIRQLERVLISEYRALVERALAGLSAESYERAVQLAELPDLIRGYESVKLKNVERFRAAARDLGFADETTQRVAPLSSM